MDCFCTGLGCLDGREKKEEKPARREKRRKKTGKIGLLLYWIGLLGWERKKKKSLPEKNQRKNGMILEDEENTECAFVLGMRRMNFVRLPDNNKNGLLGIV